MLRNLEWSVLYGASGRPVGSIAFRGRSWEYKEECKKVAIEFLSRISKQEGENMGARNPETMEKTNMVFLAGIVKASKIEDERAWFTIDVGLKQWVPVVGENKEIAERLRGLSVTDFIQMKAIIQPWSKKNGEKWDRGIKIEITEVKTIVKGAGVPNRGGNDDDLPF